MKMADDSDDNFAIPELPFGPVPDGTSILLTGDNTAVIEAVFYHLTTAREGERSLILATETNGRTINRELDRVVYGASSRSTVLTCAGPSDESNVTTIEDISDLTGVGMQFSALVTESGTMAKSQRAGILLASTICSEVDDLNSVFQFLNANFLAHLRRNGILGVCALDTSTSVDEDVIESMSGAFTAHLAVETTDTDQLKLHLKNADDESEPRLFTLPE